MNERIKYESVEELKADLTPMEDDPAKSKESHARFERFAKLVSQSSFVDELSSGSHASTRKSTVHGSPSDR